MVTLDGNFRNLNYLGFLAAMNVENERIQKENEAIEAANARLPEGATPKPLTDLFTPQSYFDKLVDGWSFSHADTHKERLAAEALQKLSTMPPQKAAPVIQAMGLGYVLAISDPAQRADALAGLALPKYLSLTREEKDTLVPLVHPELFQ